MHVLFKCPSCESPNGAHLPPNGGAAPDTPSRLECSRCEWHRDVPADWLAQGRVHRCAACGSRDLYVRKDFPQKLGLGIVIVGFVLSSIAWSQYWVIATFAILFATALLDVALYFLVGDVLVCYCCGAQYRSTEPDTGHGPFDLEVAERYRQQEARMRSLSNRNS